MFSRPFLYLAAFALQLSFASCDTHTQSQELLQKLDSSIATTNSNTTAINGELLDALKWKAEDWKTKEKAMLWLPKAEHVQSLTKNLVNYIVSLKKQLLTRAVNQADIKIVKAIFLEEGKSNELFNRLLQYQQALKAIDSNAYENTKVIFIKNISSDSINNKKSFYYDKFADLTNRETGASLNLLQNNILNAEGKYLRYFLDRMVSHSHTEDYVSFEGIVAQSTKILKAGDELEITAGLGTFSYQRQPTITIGSKIIVLNTQGLAIHKFKTSQKVGHYSLPVKIAFIDQDGKQQERTFTINYSLVDTIKQIKKFMP